jgi:hypothetical protein
VGKGILNTRKLKGAKAPVIPGQLKKLFLAKLLDLDWEEFNL